MKIRPSSLDALAKCPCFDPAGSDYADAGTARHSAFHGLNEGSEFEFVCLPDEEQPGVKWASDYVNRKAMRKDHPFITETKVEATLSDFTVISGTPDIVCGPDLFDLKWRYRNYDLQMACYALALIQKSGLEQITVHVLYAEPQRESVYFVTEKSALALIEPVVARANDPNKKPSPCDYCGWCSMKLKCTAYIDRVNSVLAGRDDWKLEQYHASAIDDPVKMGNALRLARVLKKWCASVEHHAMKMSKEGKTPTGFELVERSGKQYVSDVARAFAVLGIPQEEFMTCVDLRLNTSKDKTRNGILYIYQKVKNIVSLAAAKREVMPLLKPFISRKKTVVSLKAISEETDSEETTNSEETE